MRIGEVRRVRAAYDPHYGGRTAPAGYAVLVHGRIVDWALTRSRARRRLKREVTRKLKEELKWTS